MSGRGYLLRVSPEGVSGDPVRILDPSWVAAVCARPHECLPYFVPKEIDQVVAECGDHEVRGGESTSTKADLEGFNIADNDNQSHLTG